VTDDRTDQRDDDLRERFQALRAEHRQGDRVPAFGDVMAGAKQNVAARPPLEVVAGGGGRAPRRRVVRVATWATAAVAAGLATVMLVNSAPSGDDDFERLVAAYATQTAGSGWSSPTSALLEVPGMDLMRSLPSIGGSLRGLDPASRPAPEEETL
jgi:hypothetical protein